MSDTKKCGHCGATKAKKGSFGPLQRHLPVRQVSGLYHGLLGRPRHGRPGYHAIYAIYA